MNSYSTTRITADCICKYPKSQILIKKKSHKKEFYASKIRLKIYVMPN